MAAITLKVPDDLAVEFVSQGEFDADLTQGTVETRSRPFANFLISEYGLTEISGRATGGNSAPRTGDSGNAAPNFEAQYPADFPKRRVFIAAQIPFETARNLSREQLLALGGIAEKTADEILAWTAAQPASEPQTTPGMAGAQNDPNGGAQ